MPTLPRSLEHLARPRTAGAGLDVFAVEDRTAQVVWSDLPEGTITLVADGRKTTMEHPGGPGAADLVDLLPGGSTMMTVTAPNGIALKRRLRTLTTPPGPELFRFATVSDLHLGRGEHGLHGHLRAVDKDAATHPLLAARAAVDQAVAWGAELLVVKGDICDETRDWTWDQAQALLADLSIPLAMIPGNHDTGRLRHFDPEVGATQRGLPLTRGVGHLDVPGLRIILVDSSQTGNGWGRVACHSHEVSALARDAAGAVFVATHHQPQRFPVPLYWPHGIPGPDADRFARAVISANPRTMASSGHTHRCRRRRVNGLTWTEVAATNHFPGVWAGYRVFEGGIMQTVRRTTEPDTLAWTEHTRDALAGVWALWSTGTMSDRSFVLSW